MKLIPKHLTLFDAIRLIHANALTGVFDGMTMDDYYMSCRWQLEAYDCTLIYTRDFGAHSSGWKKNPDFEQCYHLSISDVNKKVLHRILKGLLWQTCIQTTHRIP